MKAARTERARRTIFKGELDLDDLGRSLVDGGRPTMARSSGRAGCLLLIPIDQEVLGGKALLGLSLPMVVGTGRPDEIDAIVCLTRNQELGIKEARVHDVVTRQEIVLLEMVV